MKYIEEIERIIREFSNRDDLNVHVQIKYECELMADLLYLMMRKGVRGEENNGSKM